MAAIAKRRLLESLGPFLPDGQAEALFAAAIADAGLPERALYAPSEVAVIARAIMGRAQLLGAVAVSEAEAVAGGRGD